MKGKAEEKIVGEMDGGKTTDRLKDRKSVYISIMLSL